MRYGVGMVDGALRREVEQLIGKSAAAAEFTNLALRAEMRAGLSGPEWTDSIGTLARIAAEDFSWLSPGDAVRLRFSASRQISVGLTECWPFQTESPTEEDLKELLGAYVDWIASQPDSRVCSFCWSILRAQPRRQGSNAQLPIYWLVRQGRLSGDIAMSSIELAVTLTDEENAMFWWPDERWSIVRWDTAAIPYLHFLNDESSLVRAAASKALGRLHAALRDSDEATNGLPPLAELLDMIGSRERSSAGVAGPFLEGSDWGIDDWQDLLGDFDIRRWFLDTLRHSDSEPDWPEAQALEFYAQEYFAADGAAIEEMIDMGREELAFMTATANSNNIEVLRPVLEQMARSNDERLAKSMQGYLAEHGQRSGKQWLN